MPENDATDIGGLHGNAAYRQLLTEIGTGLLNAGDRLRENELAERLGMSRTPVREAIRQLETDGIVAHMPRHGATIRRLDYAEVMELYEMRSELEGTSARLAARRCTEVELDELEKLNHALAKAGITPRAMQLNRQFHAGLLDAAKNRFLLRAVHSLQKALMILGPTAAIDAHRAEQAVEEHFGILDAIKAGDCTLAEAAMRAHIERALRVRLQALRSAPFFDGDPI